jgi:hypothetical protein
MGILNAQEITKTKRTFNLYDDENLSGLIVTLSRLGLDCIDTIEAQQQEIERLKVQMIQAARGSAEIVDLAVENTKMAQEIVLIKAEAAKIPDVCGIFSGPCPQPECPAICTRYGRSE